MSMFIVLEGTTGYDYETRLYLINSDAIKYVQFEEDKKTGSRDLAIFFLDGNTITFSCYGNTSKANKEKYDEIVKKLLLLQLLDL